MTAIRLSTEIREAVDAWAARQADKPGRSEAIRQLVELGLTVEGSARQNSNKQKRRAQDIAAGAIDRMTDSTASTADKAQRKQRLLKGPSEFVGSRIDKPKRK